MQCFISSNENKQKEGMLDRCINLSIKIFRKLSETRGKRIMYTFIKCLKQCIIVS